MALTVATHQPPDEGNWIFYTGGIGVSDNDVLLTLPCAGAVEVVVFNATGAVDCFPIPDGTNAGTTALALEDLTSTTPATKVVVTTAMKPARISTPGYRAIRFDQNAATAVTGLVVAVRYKQ